MLSRVRWGVGGVLSRRSDLVTKGSQKPSRAPPGGGALNRHIVGYLESPGGRYSTRRHARMWLNTASGSAFITRGGRMRKMLDETYP